MRAIRFLPLVFLIGIDGFAMFAPYLIVILAIGYALRMFRSPPQTPAGEPDTIAFPA